MTQLRAETEKADAELKKKEIEIKNPGHGYGGKFGVEKDRMDKSAVGHDYVGKGMCSFCMCTYMLLYMHNRHAQIVDLHRKTSCGRH